MPVVNGKAQRTKNKIIKVTVNEILETVICNDDGIMQYVEIL